MGSGMERRCSALWAGALGGARSVCGGPGVVSSTQVSHFVTTYTRMQEGYDMARGRKTSLTIRLTPAERQTLLAWQRSTTISAGQARRGRMLLLLADGVPISHIAAVIGSGRRFVYMLVRRFLEEGLAGLADKRGRR